MEFFPRQTLYYSAVPSAFFSAEANAFFSFSFAILVRCFKTSSAIFFSDSSPEEIGVKKGSTLRS